MVKNGGMTLDKFKAVDKNPDNYFSIDSFTSSLYFNDVAKGLAGNQLSPF